MSTPHNIDTAKNSRPKAGEKALAEMSFAEQLEYINVHGNDAFAARVRTESMKR